MSQEEDYEEDYEDDEYEDDFDDFDGEVESPQASSSPQVQSIEHAFEGSHSVLQGTKSSPRKGNTNIKSDISGPQSAWYEGNIMNNMQESPSSPDSSNGNHAVAPEPMPPAYPYKAPTPTIVDSAHFTRREKTDIHSSIWTSDRVPSTAESARGSAALIPYHTQSIRRGHWRLGKKIGAGTFGVVHQGLNEDTGMAVAVKVMKRVGRDEAAVKELENEITLMQRLDHPNIVRYLGCQVDADVCYIFCEWVPCGSLADMIKNYGPLGEPVLKRYLRQMLCGLEYLHERLIVHRDLKGGNVLVNEFGEAKLADFGCSKTMSADGTLGEVAHGSIKGTPYFMAPEVIKNERAGRPSDIWSLGGVIFQMATGDPPWKSHNFKTPVVLFYHVVNAADPPPLSGVSEELILLVNSCFARKPADRPTARDMLQNDYFKDLALETQGKDQSLAITHEELADIFAPIGNHGGKTPLPSPPATEIPSPEYNGTSPATSTCSIGSNMAEETQAEKVVEKVRVEKVERKTRKKVERKWGVSGYQKPSTAPDGPTRQAEAMELRPITAPDQNTAPKQPSSLSKFKKRFQDPARISMHELQVTQTSQAGKDRHRSRLTK